MSDEQPPPSRPIPVPADPALLKEMRRLIDANSSPYEVVSGGIDDDGVPFVKVRRKGAPSV
jgi:hypothetical protein